MNKELANALMTIKAECDRHLHCVECPLTKYCEREPFLWKLDRCPNDYHGGDV